LASNSDIKLYYSIGEVCKIVGVESHVLRYWETEFSELSPRKNRGGKRVYRKYDIEMALRIKELLYDERYTIEGAKRRLKSYTYEEGSAISGAILLYLKNYHKLDEIKRGLVELKKLMDD